MKNWHRDAPSAPVMPYNDFVNNQPDQMTDEYYNDYPKEPIGGGNPYYCCSYCKISDPQINGELKNHAEWCEYRIKMEAL